MSHDFESGDIVVKKDEDNRTANNLPEPKLEILGVLERLDTEGENLYMVARGRPIECEKIDRNYKLKEECSKD